MGTRPAERSPRAELLLPFDSLTEGYFRVPDELVTSGALAAWDGATLRVFLALLHHRNRQTGRAFPSFATLGRTTGLHRGTVLRAVQLLKAAEAITDDGEGWKIGRPVAPAQHADPVAPAQQPASDVAPAREDVAPARADVAPALGAHKEEPNKLTQRVNPTPGAAVGPTSELIYAAYPRKAAKPFAVKAIDKATERLGGRGPPPLGFGSWAAWLLDRTTAYAAARRDEAAARPDAAGYTPYPATWFNSHQYDDDPSTWAPKARGAQRAPKTSDEQEAARGESKSGLPSASGMLARRSAKAARPGDAGAARGGAAPALAG